MRRVVIPLLIAIGLTGCATPVTHLKNPTTGETATCGGGMSGSIVGGMVGYSIQKSNDDDCVADLEKAGFIPYYPGFEPASAVTTGGAGGSKPESQ